MVALATVPLCLRRSLKYRFWNNTTNACRCHSHRWIKRLQSLNKDGVTPIHYWRIEGIINQRWLCEWWCTIAHGKGWMTLTFLWGKLCLIQQVELWRSKMKCLVHTVCGGQFLRPFVFQWQTCMTFILRYSSRRLLNSFKCCLDII